MNDSELIKLIKTDKEQGFRCLFDTYWRYAYAIAFNILRDNGSREDIEECTADTLSSVMRAFSTERDGSLKAYIGTTAKRKAIDRLRASSSEICTVSLDSEDAPELPSEENIAQSCEAAEQARLILDIVKKLGEPDSQIIIQKFFYDRNSAEIARILKMNPITVRSRCKRAIARLREELRQLDIDL